MARQPQFGNVQDNGAAELPLEDQFVEQAEYIDEATFLAISATHPEEESIVRRLSAGGAKLLVGPRGCGKTTLMLKVFYSLLRDHGSTVLPVYVNFKLSLKLEPLYANTPNATFWFRLWLNLKIYQGLSKSLQDSTRVIERSSGLPSDSAVAALISSIEAGRLDSEVDHQAFSTHALTDAINLTLQRNRFTRCVLLLDDAAHAFSPRQQEDFFEFFRQIKSRQVSPKAAIYPGITSHSPTFHVGHDAEQIDMWVKPDSGPYLDFMRSLATKRFNGELPATLASSTDTLDFLAFAAFGIPRSFLNMLRAIYLEESRSDTPSAAIDRRKVLVIAKESRELSHNVYDSLAHKLPSYKEFVETGRKIFNRLVSELKSFNRDRPDDNQGLQVGIKRPVTPEIEKVFGFLQYAGLIMPAGHNSRGVKGTFDLFMIHYGELATENAIIGRRTKSIPAFVAAFKSQTHQAWPRIAAETIAPIEHSDALFRLVLPNCQICGAERSSEHAKFCHNCGAQLKATSLYNDLISQDITALPLSIKIIKRIREHSDIRTIKDILMDTEKIRLRGIPWIGPVRAKQIANYAEEHVA